jgi:methionyl-tRNA synthetase
VGKWEPSALPAGQPLGEPAPLFRKLDDSVVAEELARLEATVAPKERAAS